MISRTFLAFSALLLAGPACAQGVYPYASGEDGFAGPLVRGTYIGAPLTRVPRPSQLVPSAWSYGTYGIPTVTGIAAPPALQPTITVINATGPAIPRPARAHRADGFGYAAPQGNPQAGAQIVTIQVPRR